MNRRIAITGLLLSSWLLVACDSGPETNPQAFSSALKQDASARDEWRHYLGDSGFSHASPLAQINRDNVQQLQPVWRYTTSRNDYDIISEMQCSPLVVRGILYCTSPALDLFALNAATGELLWEFKPPQRGDRHMPNVNRGVSYWEDGDDRRILYTVRHWLLAVDALTGKAVSEFGNNGRVDMRVGLPAWAEDAALAATTPGTVYQDLLIMGSRVSEFKGAAPGHIRAFDIRTGELRWVFNTIPKDDEFGADTWPAAARHQAGGANAWAGIAVDHDRGIAFAPIGAPTFDFFGGDRAGDNLFGNSLVALNAATGERLWHYQVVRHDIWDRDLPAPPNLITLRRNGKAVPAVAQVTKTGHVFVFHRETGEPLFPVGEVPVVGKAVPGEFAADSQPIPLELPAFANQSFAPTDRNPVMRAAVEKRMKTLEPHALYRPPSIKGTIHYPGIDGGAEWGGAAWDEQRQMLFVNANEVPYLLAMTEVAADEGLSPKFAYLMTCAGCHGADRRGDGVSIPGLVDISERLSFSEAWSIVRDGRGRMPAFSHMRWYERAAVMFYLYTAGDPADNIQETKKGESLAGVGGNYLNAGYQKFLDPEGLPASKPPWGTLSAIDLKKKRIAWRIPLGDYPALLQQGVSGLGSENYGGPVITAGGLLFIAATPDRLLKAYDIDTGKLLWQYTLPFAGFATPATYRIDGRQYLVIAAGGGKLGQPSGGELIAFALPDTTHIPD